MWSQIQRLSVPLCILNLSGGVLFYFGMAACCKAVHLAAHSCPKEQPILLFAGDNVSSKAPLSLAPANPLHCACLSARVKDFASRNLLRPRVHPPCAITGAPGKGVSLRLNSQGHCPSQAAVAAHKAVGYGWSFFLMGISYVGKADPFW